MRDDLEYRREHLIIDTDAAARCGDHVRGDMSTTAMPNGMVVASRVECAPIDPWDAVPGQIYFNVIDGGFWGYNGTRWRRLDRADS